MALLSGNIIIAFAALCFCNKKLLFSMNYKVFSLLLGILILRLMIPVEFSFAPVITMPGSLSQAAAYLSDPLFTAGSLNISLSRIFEFIWVIGSILCLVKIIRQQIILSHTVTSDGKDVTQEGRYFDTLTRAAIDLLIIIFWWNPLCYLLRGQMTLVSAVSQQLDAKASDSTAGRFHRMIRETNQPLYIAVLAVTVAIFLLSYCFIL